MKSNNAPGITSHQTLAVIDTAMEIKVGVGYDWKPVVLGNNEIQIPSQLAKYLNVTIGDKVSMNFNFDGIANEQFMQYSKMILSTAF